jgi:type II secretory pathway pseudopilin PulG
MEDSKGFTVAELLITVTVVALLGATILPNLLRSRVAAGESAAVSSIREINRAEIAYQAAYPTVGFSANLAALGPGGAECQTHSPEHACFLSPQLSVASSPEHARNGYWFLVSPGSKNRSGVVTDYVVGSAAAVFNQSGVRDFCSTEDGALWVRVPNQQSSPVTSPAECHAESVLQ